MKTLTQLAIIGVLACAAAGTTFLIKGPPESRVIFCDPSTLRPDEICLADVEKDALWIDARSRSEWEKNGLDGSILWNLDPNEDSNAFEAEAAMHLIDARQVVVYCGSEACGTSRQIADRIRSLQFGPEVKVLFGGWEAIKDSNSKP
ncbi:rhodanese-like domain-containing protein [Luteolibacter algae]|uniref:Rhodanese-like domain-containing protein n=1 Tax=Luteolibacter algae TaxID=454151 RepID=A0ABW5D452_9BACT